MSFASISRMYGRPRVVREGIWSHATASYDVPAETEAALLRINLAELWPGEN